MALANNEPERYPIEDKYITQTANMFDGTGIFRPQQVSTEMKQLMMSAAYSDS